MTHRLAALSAAIALAVLTGHPTSAPARSGDCGYYTNSSGQVVSRPCRDPHADPRHRPTAICRDGSYSFSQHPYSGGTCSHHGGVAQYL